jgi:PAS domain S-box-containing protein
MGLPGEGPASPRADPVAADGRRARAPSPGAFDLERFFLLSKDLMVVAGFDGYFHLVNPAWQATFGWNPEEMRSRPWLEFVHPDDVERTVAAGRRLTERHLEVQSFDNRYRTRDGSYRWLRWTAVPSPEGSAIYAVARDVTEAREAEDRIRHLARDLEAKIAELSAANRELEAFSWSVSHDLRAPLRSIDGFSRALLEDHADRLDEDGRDALHRVRAATVRMGGLIDDLLTLSRITRSEMTRGPVDLSALAAQVSADLRAAEPSRDVVFSIAPGLVVEGDARLLDVLLRNLLGNAWKYTAKNARAHVTFGVSESRGDSRVFSVRDDGAGFDMKYADRLFGVFQRLHATSEFPGTGIGLATARRIVERHGGRIWGEGRPNAGAVFSFTL